LVGAAVYVYMNYVKPRVEPNYVENSEFQKTNNNTEAELYFFYTTWCPHCKRAKPEWESLKSEYESKTINGVKVLFKGVDCDKEEDLANKFGVEGYPTIKLVKDGQVIEYDAKPKKDTLVEFLEQAL
jgi:thiol-disulfide isomerase/thioredoxin